MLSNILSPFLVIDEYDVASHHEYMLSDIIARVRSYNQDWEFVGLHVRGCGMGFYIRMWNLI